MARVAGADAIVARAEDTARVEHDHVDVARLRRVEGDSLGGDLRAHVRVDARSEDVVFGESALRVVGESDGRAGARVDDALHAGRARRRKRILRPLDRGSLDVARVGGEVAMRRGDVEHDVDALARSLEALAIEDVTFVCIDIEPVQRAAVGLRAHERDDFHVCGERRAHDVTPDVPVRSGDQRSHRQTAYAEPPAR